MSEQTDTMDVNGGAPEQGAADQEGAAAPGENYQTASFDELGEGAAGATGQGETSLDVILDIPVTLSMEIGRSRISIENLLQLAKGSCEAWVASFPGNGEAAATGVGVGSADA